VPAAGRAQSVIAAATYREGRPLPSLLFLITSSEKRVALKRSPRPPGLWALNARGPFSSIPTRRNLNCCGLMYRKTALRRSHARRGMRIFGFVGADRLAHNERRSRLMIAGMSREAREHGRGGTHTLEEEGEKKHHLPAQRGPETAFCGNAL
jgi:hypothetical protein